MLLIVWLLVAVVTTGPFKDTAGHAASEGRGRCRARSPVHKPSQRVEKFLRICWFHSAFLSELVRIVRPHGPVTVRTHNAHVVDGWNVVPSACHCNNVTHLVVEDGYVFSATPALCVTPVEACVPFPHAPPVGDRQTDPWYCARGCYPIGRSFIETVGLLGW